MDETVDLARQAMRDRTGTRHVALNVAKLVNMRSDAVLATDVRTSDLVGVDGMGIVFAARVLGIRIAERVAGIDLFPQPIVCLRGPRLPAIPGGTDRVVRQSGQRRSPSKILQFHLLGVRDGYFTPEQEAQIVNDIRGSGGADCLFIGMPTPPQGALSGGAWIRWACPLLWELADRLISWLARQFGLPRDCKQSGSSGSIVFIKSRGACGGDMRRQMQYSRSWSSRLWRRG